MILNDLKDEIDIWLNNYFCRKEGYNEKIYEAMAYSINVGGKRIRPILMLLTYCLYNENYKDIMEVAAAVEMIHTYSLIHDDLPCMDDDCLRRGKPTNHKVFGEAIAVLAGDGLLNEAMNIMFKYSSKHDCAALRACAMISESSGVEGMIGGQVVDILAENRKITVEELSYMHRKKTGALIKASILSGAILGNAPSSDIDILEKYGEKLGLAFQIKDDILDVIGDEDTMGKSAKKDENENKSTYVSVFGIDECIIKCEKLTNECIKLLDSVSKDTSELKQLTKFLLDRKN